MNNFVCSKEGKKGKNSITSLSELRAKSLSVSESFQVRKPNRCDLKIYLLFKVNSFLVNSILIKFVIPKILKKIKWHYE